MMNDFSLVVGGSKGIGLEIAKLFSERGDETYVLSRSKGKWNGKHIQADLSDEENLNKALSFIRDNKIRFKYVVFAQKNRSLPDNLDYELMIQLKSIKILVEGIVSLMEEGGAFVFIGSPAGRFIVKEQPLSYHLSKAALEHLTKYYAVNLGKLGIRFNCILPGTIIKESNKDFYQANGDVSNLLIKITPLQILGNTMDVAAAVDFFSSKKSRYITGQVIFVDGGQFLEGQESLARRLTFGED
ncbi:SDR family NAD(P)-dependent oxidoreductase [Leptospira santarosai]|uniref:SDR family NAD(P)-dependent oxidoreductase n=1 Tax=Leptospira santarosai TaxID=28183 RepID=UPI00095C0251|nr:SDR family oxidoreductase [Leptospira santarosai]OLY63956.1 short-chain dehydrogenase [Leptospira santarosai serovar Grippotyphosa]ONF77294.1 short-chain dehydrogenase [Leptospira santarosai serovar Bananal]ONF83312.1 short-chain dehydrogenase [Leptospira santarosai serovar Grippotyphosa]